MVHRPVTLARAAYPAIMILCLASGGPVQALTVVNQDERTNMVVIIADGEEQAFELEAGETLVGFCRTGCSAIFGDGEEISLHGSEHITIKQHRPNVRRQP